MLEECPFCHRFLAAKEISKEELGSDLFNDRVPRTASQLYAHIAAARSNPEFRPADFPENDVITYRVLYKCKNCGKEWTKLSKKEIDIPRDYAEAEREKTDYDAERKEERAREEQEAREE